MRVHYICRGNAHRSRIAEAYTRFRYPEVEVLSSGSVADEYRASGEAVIPIVDAFLAKQGIDVQMKPKAEQLTQDRLSEDDTTVCVNDVVYNECVAKGLQLPKNTIVWDIDDFQEHSGPQISFEEFMEKHFPQITAEVDALMAKNATT